MATEDMREDLIENESGFIDDTSADEKTWGWLVFPPVPLRGESSCH